MSFASSLKKLSHKYSFYEYFITKFFVGEERNFGFIVKFEVTRLQSIK